MYKFDDIFSKSSAYEYKKWGIIKDQLNLVKKYNFTHKKLGFLHPKVDDLAENTSPLDDARMDLLHETEHIKENFKPCAQPWSSVHINVDGTVFPCLAVPMGNVKDQPIKDIIFGTEFDKFRSVIKKEGQLKLVIGVGGSSLMIDTFLY